MLFLLAGLAALTPALPLFGQFYEPEPEVYEEPAPDQKRSFQALEERILELTRAIEKYQRLLRAAGLIKDGKTTRIPLRAEQQNYWGERDKRFVYNEVGVIHWNEERIDYILFEQRQSHRDRVQVLLRRWYGRIVGGGASGPENPGGIQGFALDLVVRRIDTYEGGTYVNQRLFTGRDLRGVDPGTPLPADSGEKIDQMPRVYVNQIAERLKFLREYREMVELLERRIDRAVREESNRNETRFQMLERVLQ